MSVVQKIFLLSVLVMVLAICCGIDVSRSTGAFHFWKTEPKYHCESILKAHGVSFLLTAITEKKS